jgi:Trypsin
MKKSILATISAVVLLFTAAAPSQAITYGEPDGDHHPYVGFMIFFEPDEPGWFSCSGTLLDHNTFLTAGHCTYGIGSDGRQVGTTGGSDVWVTFKDTDVLADWPARTAEITEKELYDLRSTWLNANGFTRGTSHPHPRYDNFAQFPVNYDVGVVELDQSVVLSTYGALAPIGTAEMMAGRTGKSRNAALVENVGYGIQSIQPKPQDDSTRYRSTSRIVEVNGRASKGGNLHTSNNPSQVGGVGGTCFGDSGGPVFKNGTNQILGVVSFGNSGTCHGADYSWRIDTSDSHNFVEGFLH